MQNKQVTIEDLEQGLRIDEHALEIELKEHAETFYKVSSHVAMSLSKRDEAKQALEEKEAEVDMELRKAASLSEERVTDTAIANQKKSDPKVKAANANFLRLKKEATQWETLKEAYQQRSYALSKLVDLYIANYYSDMEYKNQKNPVRIHDAKSNQVKKVLNERRHRETL